ncbi:MAG: ABC transporter ATP-binding protein [Deltaproteobacteria bacterium]|nr:ABC transporter ATP-binding protein [Deltaproteobacteria bacterium]
MRESDTARTENKPGVCLEIRDVVKKFPGVTAVDHINLEIQNGEVFSFLGPSGCGKSTLLRVVAGLENQDQGDVLIAGAVVNDLPPYKRDCSTVFQNHALFPHMTVSGNIGFGLVERRLPKNEIKRKVSEKIELVNLKGMEDRYPHQLSGGQMQRVALARSLVLEPKILLLDEPLAALDRKLRKEMQVELKRIQREVGTTFLNVTHDQKEALSLSDRIAVMNQGKFLQIGTPSEIYEAPQTTFVADFMGAVNIFLGEVASTTDAVIELENKNGSRIFVPTPENIGPDDIAGVSVHPELIRIRPWDHGAQALDPKQHTAFRGIIKEVFYQGNFSEITVQLKETDRPMVVHLTRGRGPEVRLSEGQDVCVSWQCRYSNVLRK